MLNILGRASISRALDPVGCWLLRVGIGADAITVVGTTGTVLAALWFFPRGQLLAGTIAVTFFVLFDLLDGAVARARGGGTAFGTVLDATGDRIADGALFAALVWWAFVVVDNRPLAAAALLCLVSAQVISYIKARAEATGLSANVGAVERAERYILTLVGTGLAGIGVPLALDVALWSLVALQVLTVAQRIVAVRRSALLAGTGTQTGRREER